MTVLKNCLALYRGGAEGGRESDLSGVDVLVEGNRIARVAPTGSFAIPAGARVIDASRHVVLPGLVNTHHHFYQTLTRALPAVQDAKLFDWLIYLYEIWKGVDEDAVFWSSRLAMAELLKTGSAKVGREVERGVVDVETLRKVNDALVATLEETISIQEEGRARRLEAEGEIGQLQMELRQKLLELRGTAPQIVPGDQPRRLTE